jgi:ABC-type oligopeptide transport system substrate-binding subunit
MARPSAAPGPDRARAAARSGGAGDPGTVVVDRTLSASSRSDGVARRRSRLRSLGALAVAFALAAGAVGSPVGAAGASQRDEATLVFGMPSQLDPALEGDVGSARVSAQLFESLTAIDPGLNVRPALAASWDILDDGRRIVFHLRDGLTFSDGTPLRAQDVVRSWLRVLDPAQPSPLASLLTEVVGADAYARGASLSDPTSVGFRATDLDVEVRLTRPEADFPAIVASPTFGIVPPGVGRLTDSLRPGAGFVASGAYVLSASNADELTLTANTRYWAGAPALRTIHLKTTLNGANAVDAFASGSVDYTPIGDADAGWVRYDATLGSSLRTVASLGVTYYGFDTRRPPFADVRVRHAFATAVDWKRIVTLGSAGNDIPATSMVPPAIPGRSERDFTPAYDPAGARAELAAAGYPGGAGFPQVTLVSGGGAYDQAIAADLSRELGITLHIESMDFGTYFDRLASDPPAFWSLSWVADYPGSNDFLGMLLGSGSTSNYGHWSSPVFDAAIARALAAPDAAAARAAYDDAESVVQRDAPVIPMFYSGGYALARGGLLGAAESGLGILRLAGLAWANQ